MIEGVALLRFRRIVRRLTITEDDYKEFAARCQAIWRYMEGSRYNWSDKYAREATGGITMADPPIFDGHNDTLTKLEMPERGAVRGFVEGREAGHLDLPRAREGGLAGGIFAIFAPPPEGSKERDPMYGLTFTENGYEVAPRSAIEHAYASEFTVAMIDRLAAIEAEAGGALGIVRTYADLARNLEEEVFSVVLHLEGAAAISFDLSDLGDYYAQGVRSLGLVWSRPNAFGHGAPFRFPHSPDVGPGLTAAGEALVRACNRLGIVIDLAHINEKGFWDVARLSDVPLVVSHTAVHALCPSTRNLTDAQIDAVGQSNGVIGIIFEPLNIRSDGYPEPDTPLSQIVRHIDYVAARIGIDHVAFGSDFDGAQMPATLGDAGGLPRLLGALRDAGYDGDALAKIAYRNWFRVFRDSWRE